MPQSRKSHRTGASCSFLRNCVFGLLFFSPFVAGSTRAEENSTALQPSLDASNDQDENKSENDLLAGHSNHGEAFNEGPRQQAYLMGGTGNVSFSVSTRSAQAQSFFNQGIGQLHGFWYFEAERSFRQVAMLDADCAMAYWGMAMANDGNKKRAKEFIAKAVERKDNASPRERLWIDGLDAYLNSEEKTKEAKRSYLRDLEKIIHQFPDDVEAKAFLAVRIWQFKGDLPIPSYQAVDALLDQVFAANPMHPAHHYRIHLWDREKPERALASAAQGGQAGPSIAHLWHMPGHIYSRLKRYDDAVWQQEASSRADHAHMMRDRVLPDQIHNYAHNQEWMTRNLINVGRSGDALAIATNLVEHPRHPKFNTLKKRGRSASYGRTRLFQVLERFEMWDDLIKLAGTMYLEPTSLEAEQDKRIRALGLAHFENQDARELLAQTIELQARLTASKADRAAAQEEAEQKAKQEQKSKKEITDARVAAGKAFDERIESLEAYVAELTAYGALLVGSTEAATTLLDQVEDVEKDRLARLYLQAGDAEKAEQLAQEAVDAAEKEVIPLANQIDILYRIGKQDEAVKSFNALREISGQIDDLTKAPFQRLVDIAPTLGLPSDWRVAATPSNDVGQRPTLGSIGPLRYSPPRAADWMLPDGDGQTMGLNEFRGRPVVVIFYLGYGCLHCVEQLTTFAPRTNDFAEAGVALVGIGTDDIKDLKKSVDNFKVDGEFPFPLLSDVQLGVFKEYRAFDDFEDQPLHGTFLIDADGLVRWQDISYEPFDDVDFLLKESKRLLGLPSNAAGSTFAAYPAADNF